MRNKLNNKGFTLIELIVVIAILAVIAAIAVPIFGGLISNAQQTACKENMTNLYRAFAVETTLHGGIESYISNDALEDEFVATTEKYLHSDTTSLCESGGTYSITINQGGTYTIACSKHPENSLVGNQPCTPESLGPVMTAVFGKGAGNSGTLGLAAHVKDFDSEAGAGSFSDKAKEEFKNQGFNNIDDYMWLYQKVSGTFYIVEKSSIPAGATSVTVQKYLSDGTVVSEEVAIETHKSGYPVLVPDGRDNVWNQ